ncbi:hypothetical protein GXP71_17545 [Cellulomonas sp. H30R-01]|uniref:hypothetical protein n=1 Tax=Cellulomonas sp. H30R-01 TaxID=2704467 RepID=UPI00138D9348|nr:hypothetical protein [Cellulomonas sp. H30R-01]QHT57700.1 hypothetical protein GXP71_17545 [Cellulomonas sp. H30R-01]
MHDEPGHRDDAAPGTAGRTYRPHAGTWNTRVQPVTAVPVVRHDPFAALGHDASRHGQVAGPAHALHDKPDAHVAERAPGHPTHSLWPHADEPSDGPDDRPTVWQPHVAWRPTPSVPFPRPAPSSELDPPTWG